MVHYTRKPASHRICGATGVRLNGVRRRLCVGCTSLSGCRSCYSILTNAVGTCLAITVAYLPAAVCELLYDNEAC